MSTNAQTIIRKLLEKSGIAINGPNPYDIHIKNAHFYARILKNPALNLGETYVEGWWDCARLDEFFFRLLRADLENIIAHDKRFLFSIIHAKCRSALNHLINFQTRARAPQVGRHHYDKGNALFQCMLDKRMNYSCAYWKNSATLNDAQEAKLELICRKLYLRPGMRVLDIGCGWGGFARYAAEKHEVEVVGVTISRQQADYAKEYCKGLPVDIRLQDYRDINERFDRVSSIGMFEHVGHKNYRDYMQTVQRCLADGDLFLLHTIGANDNAAVTNEWIKKYIFPNGELPSMRKISRSIEGLFVMEDWHNFGADYDKTLMAWHDNFNQHWDTLRKNYDERFRRLWNYYLLSCAGAFRARDIQLWQIVLAKGGVLNGYSSSR